MKKLIAILFVAILVGSVTVPSAFSSNEQDDKNDNNKINTQNNNDHSDNENTNTQENDPYNKTKMKFEYSNATSIGITLPNGTRLTFSYSNGTNPGQQISSFAHQIHDVFKQQKDLAKQTIKDCRQKARDSNPSERKSLMDQCKASLKQINQQFNSEHKQFQLDFKQFREMVTTNNKESHTKSTTFQNTAKIQHITQTNTKQYRHEQSSLQHGKDHQQNHGKKD